MSKLEVAFFDFDKTLIPFSSGRYLIREFLRIKQISLYKALYLFVMELAYRFGYLDIQSVMNESITFLEGMKHDELKIVLDDIYLRHIKPKLHPEAVKAISEHKNAGRKVIIVSNNLSIFLAKTIEDWRIDEVVANEILIDEGITRGSYTKKLCYGHGKIDRIKELPFFDKIDLSQSYFYSDSCYDIPLLEFVGKPICVNADPKLKKWAVKKKAELLTWN